MDVVNPLEMGVDLAVGGIALKSDNPLVGSSLPLGKLGRSSKDSREKSSDEESKTTEVGHCETVETSTKRL